MSKEQNMLGTLLESAVKEGALDEIKTLLKKGANPNRQDLLSEAIASGRIDAPLCFIKVGQKYLAVIYRKK